MLRRFLHGLFTLAVFAGVRHRLHTQHAARDRRQPDTEGCMFGMQGGVLRGDDAQGQYGGEQYPTHGSGLGA